jgi:cytidine deaminase
MQNKQLILQYEEYGSDSELSAEDALLLTKARKAIVNAYAPYSRFRVGAAARLNNNEIITGTNQENASFPAGICAERTVLSAIASLYPHALIDSLAISYDNGNGPSDQPISPCGICRQSLKEFETRTQQPIRLILGGRTGPVYVIPDAGSLLPLAFVGDDLA